MSGAGKFGPVEVFRAGSFTDMTGGRQTINEATLREIASGYDREAAPAPVVIGHPQTDTPAFGWVEALYVERGVLKATLEQTAAEFADAVKAGRFKKVSISLFLPNAAANPKPGSFYLKHVGFLGAAAPAVSGLMPVKFAATGGDSLPFYQDAFAAPASAAETELARLRRQVREREVEELIAEGRVLPVFKDELVAFAASLDDTETVSFSEGATATRKDWFLSYLKRQPKVVSFGVLDLGQVPFEGGRPRQDQTIPDGYSADRTHDELLHAARQIAREKGVSFSDAEDMAMEGLR
ncbi:hypothetical protein [Rhodovulum euryhalinum]|uniref:Uncharacterized protein n=1 Tax=Rhodovulum euryhalinum TaxID=35805 RepID=A0A4R2KLK3_9RHOB|nr:hypothetical protein [Rhodovulum euryhalinum]TCO74284.1 hypothetical protein EV655_101446 [Rhodovulum euryhalinum]